MKIYKNIQKSIKNITKNTVHILGIHKKSAHNTVKTELPVPNPQQLEPTERFMRMAHKNGQEFQQEQSLKKHHTILNQRLEKLNNPSGLTLKQMEQSLNDRLRTLNKKIDTL